MNVMNTTIARLDNALAIEGKYTTREWYEDECVYEFYDTFYLFKQAVKPVSGKALSWMLNHGGKEWLKNQGFEPAVLDTPTFNPKHKYIIRVDADGFYDFYRYEDYLSWKY